MKKSIFADVSLRNAEQLVGRLRPDDGLDPREEAKRRYKDRKTVRSGPGHGGHKQEQFQSQVHMAIESALQAAASPVLNCLLVREVVQQGGALLVVVSPLADETTPLAEIRQQLETAAPMLRREVAAAITRKETPVLSFVLLPPEAAKVDG